MYDLCSMNAVNSYVYVAGVTTNKILDNQQVTKELYCFANANFNTGTDNNNQQTLVGTSEAECSRTLSDKKQERHFNEWLAGLIDGDGCFLISKEGYASCEITAGLLDEPMLLYVKNRLGGSVKPRSGCKAVRWRLHNRMGIITLVNRVNGLIRNSKRVVQLQRVCELYNISFLSPKPLHPNSCWYAGFFDSDGTITFSIKGQSRQIQLRLGVTNKLECDVIMFKERFGGSLYYDRSQNGYYSVTISRADLINDFIRYSKICAVRSVKGKRLLLVPQLVELNRIKAHKSDPNSALYKAWCDFMKKWDSAKA